jgi:hypothetical protein
MLASRRGLSAAGSGSTTASPIKLLNRTRKQIVLQLGLEDIRAMAAERRTQAKFMWAVTTHTPAEMIVSRANADHENMGLRTWKGDHVTQADVDVAKNYLAESEILKN